VQYNPSVNLLGSYPRHQTLIQIRQTDGISTHHIVRIVVSNTYCPSWSWSYGSFTTIYAISA